MRRVVVIVLAALIVVIACLSAVFGADTGPPNSKEGQSEPPNPSLASGNAVPDSPQIRSSADLLPDPAHFFVRVRSSNLKPLEGAKAHLHASISRVVSNGTESLARSDSQGLIRIAMASLAGKSGVLSVSCSGYESAIVSVDGLELGRIADAVLRATTLMTCEVLDPAGRPVEAARVTVSRKSVLTELSMSPPPGMSPGPDSGSAIYSGMTNADGRVTLEGLPVGSYYCYAQASHMMPVAGLSSAVIVPMDSVRRITMGYVYAAVFTIPGDEIVACNPMYPTAALSASARLLLEREKKSLLTQFPGSTVVTALLPFNIQSKSRSYSANSAVFCRGSGWLSLPLTLTPIVDLKPTEIAALPAGVQTWGIIKCAILSPSGASSKTSGSAILIRGQDSDPLRQLMVVLQAGGEEEVVPVGQYQVIKTNPFLSIDSDIQQVAVGAGEQTVVRARWHHEMVLVEPRVESEDGDKALIFSIQVKDVESETSWRLSEITADQRIFLPVDRRLTISYAAPGWDVVQAEVTIRKQASEWQPLVLRFSQ